MDVTDAAGATQSPRGGPRAPATAPADLACMDEESVLILRGLPPAQLCEPVTTPAGAPLAAWKWLRAMVEYEVHHRGQLYLMLGMSGVARPLIHGLTSEQVRERSIHA